MIRTCGWLSVRVMALAELPQIVLAEIPRFEQENLADNEALVDHVKTLAHAKGVTPGQTALAWLLAQQSWIVPIPGTRSMNRVQENSTATTVGLPADERADLDALLQRIGVKRDRYNPQHMSYLDQELSARPSAHP
jgi:aryl-alcohol dehydrogenase-like predicted oxidoreductase